jgi:hypothetical protein
MYRCITVSVTSIGWGFNLVVRAARWCVSDWGSILDITGTAFVPILDVQYYMYSPSDVSMDMT